jgi:histidyl-tRNA synthetase
VSIAIPPVKGMNDLLPAEAPLWQHLEGTVRELLHAYGYTPMSSRRRCTASRTKAASV